MRKYKFPISNKTPIVECKVFEDNSGAIEIAMTHKYCPRIKHLNHKLHHFRDYFNRKEIVVVPVSLVNQRDDYLTKPVTLDVLKKLR